MYCRMCGKELSANAARCDECGTPVDGRYENCDNGHQTNEAKDDNSTDINNSANDTYSYSDYSQSEEHGYDQKDGRRGFAIASMVIGIVGLVFSCCSLVTFGVLNLLLGVVGLILGILGLKSQSKGMAIAGIVMASLNLIIGVLMLILMVAGLSMTNNMTPDQLEALYESLEYMY